MSLQKTYYSRFRFKNVNKTDKYAVMSPASEMAPVRGSEAKIVQTKVKEMQTFSFKVLLAAFGKQMDVVV